MLLQPSSRTADQANREFRFDAEDFRQIAAMLYSDAGIYLSDEKTSLVYSRLVKRLRELGLESFKDYCRLVASDGGIDERQKMLAALTTNVTRFYREPHHFEYLKKTVLPPLLEAAKRGGRVRIWSAGCSKGQEPYTIAMTILSMMPEAADRDVRILATDIDPNVLETARAGLYEADEFADVPKSDVTRFFKPVNGVSGSMFSATEPMRRLIAFKKLNLVGEWPMSGRFDVIFCRNVVIYFDEKTQAEIWRRYAKHLLPGGILCIGHSERLSGPAQARFKTVGTTIFKLTDGAPN
jgi:chemotaxis protein methyltransferase CheR